MDGRGETCGCRELKWRRQDEYGRGDGRTLCVRAAGHRAGHHGDHVMAAIHVMRRRGGRFVVMMLGYGALIRGAAGGAVRGPRGGGERSIE